MHNEKLNYSNKEVYLGIDVHRKKYVVCAVVKGEVVDTFSFSGSERDFVVTLERRYGCSKLVKSCYEAGFSGFGLHRRLEEVGFSNSVVHAGAIEVSSIKKKTDKRDAKKMGLQLYSGTLRGIYIPTKAQ